MLPDQKIHFPSSHLSKAGFLRWLSCLGAKTSENRKAGCRQATHRLPQILFSTLTSSKDSVRKTQENWNWRMIYVHGAMAHTRGVKGEETHLFPDQKTFNNRHKTQPLNPALEFNGCGLFLVIISYRFPVNFMTQMPSLNPPTYR